MHTRNLHALPKHWRDPPTPGNPSLSQLAHLRLLDLADPVVPRSCPKTRPPLYSLMQQVRVQPLPVRPAPKLCLRVPSLCYCTTYASHDQSPSVPTSTSYSQIGSSFMPMSSSSWTSESFCITLLACPIYCTKICLVSLLPIVYLKTEKYADSSSLICSAVLFPCMFCVPGGLKTNKLKTGQKIQ